VNLGDVLLLWSGGERVQIGDDEKALVLVLPPHAIFQTAHVVTQVQFTRGSVPC